MKYRLLLFLLIILQIFFCKDNNNKPQTIDSKINSTNGTNSQGTNTNKITVFVKAKSGLVLRKEPNKNSEKLDLIPYGTKLYINSESIPYGGMDDSSAWLEMEFNGKTGYLYGEFLDFADPQKQILSKWNCSTLYNYNPGTETYSGERILFADNTYLLIGTVMERYIEDLGNFTQSGDKFSFTSKMGNGSNDLYIYNNLLLPLEDKNRVEKNPNIIQSMEQEMFSNELRNEPNEQDKIIMLICKK